jgi:thioredoxin 1
MAESGSVLAVNDRNFSEQILESDVPALVDFWADRCEPCLTISSLIEELAKEYGGRIKVAKFKVEGNPRTPEQFGVRGIPTLIFFRHGRLFDRLVGVVSKERLRQMVEKAIKQ